MAPASGPPVRWLKVLDQTRCIGCHACTTACKSENEVPVGVTRTYVKSVDVGVFPQARRAFQVTRCNQCTDAPCVTACPTQAMFRREDGIVDFDKSVCIGCKACMAACPYDAIFINPEDHSAEKCNMCAHRLDIGLEPACVTVCPTEAILVGDLNDPTSPVAQIVGAGAGPGAPPGEGDPARCVLQGRAPGDAGPAGGAPAGRRPVRLGHPGGTGRAARYLRPSRPGRTSSAAALLSYDVPHQAPWGWRVSLYTWTKSIAAGAFLRAGAARASWATWAGATRCVRWAAPTGRAGLPGGHRRAADLGSQAPAAVLPDLHPASLAQLAGPRLVHHRRLRRGGRRCTCWPRWRARRRPAGARRDRAAAGAGHCGLHRVPVRAGQGPGPVAEPAAARRTWPSRRCWPALRRSCRPRLALAGRAVTAAEVHRWPSPLRSTSCRWWPRPRCRM